MNELEFLCPDGDIFKCELYIENFNDETLQNDMRPILFKNYLTILLKTHSYNDLLIFYNDGVEVSKKELERIVWKKDLPIYKCVKIVKICSGCRDGIANQLGHMNPGDCLYDPNN